MFSDQPIAGNNCTPKKVAALYSKLIFLRFHSIPNSPAMTGVTRENRNLCLIDPPSQAGIVRVQGGFFLTAFLPTIFLSFKKVWNVARIIIT